MKNKILAILLVISTAHHVVADTDWGKIASVAIPLIAAAGGGVGKQWWDNKAEDVHHSQNPVVWEGREAGTDARGNDHVASQAAGLQVGGASAHVKVPTSFDLGAAWEKFAPKVEAGIDKKHDKAIAVEDRTEENTNRTAYAKLSLSEDCKFEVRGKVSNSLVMMLFAGLGWAAKTYGPGLVGRG